MCGEIVDLMIHACVTLVYQSSVQETGYINILYKETSGELQKKVY